MEPYQPRAFRFIELCRFGKWRMKLYGIACQGEFPRSELLAAAKKIAATELAKFEPNDFYLGFIGAHDGRNAALIFIDFWGNGQFESKRFGTRLQNAGSNCAAFRAKSEYQNEGCSIRVILLLSECSSP